MDIFESRLQNFGSIGQFQKQFHGYFTFPKLEGSIQSRMTFRGKEVLTWSLNNYLGLANHPEVRQTDADAAKEYGLGYPMGARMMSGQTSMHEELERQLASFVGKEDAFLLNFGYQGMVSIIDALLGRNDVAVYDSESHACIIDGLRMHVGKRFVFPHNDIENLEKQLERAKKITAKTGGGIMVITEGVFGMAGDLGDLKSIAELKKKYDFRLVVDDAHGIGTMGKTGAGAGEHLGVQNDIDVYFGTFAKAFAAIGAFVATRADVCQFLRYNMRSQTFAKSLPMPLVIGLLKRLELLRDQPEHKAKLWGVVEELQGSLKAEGFDLGDTASPVTPVYLKGGMKEITNLIMDFRENYGIFCSGVMYPVVPKDTLLLRLIPTAMHSSEDVKETIAAFKAVKAKLDSGEYGKMDIPQI